MKFRHLPYLQEKSFEDLWKYNGAKLESLPVPIDEITAQKIIRLDPTTIAEENGKINKIGNYAEWLLMKIFAKLPEEAQDNMLGEDKERVYKVLRTFDRNKAKIQNRDINSYKTFDALAEVVKPFEETLTRADQKEAIRKDIEVIADDGDWIVKSPKTEAAACILGKGSKWCTAAESHDNNYFDDYTKKNHPGSHIYVFINQENPELKYQLHIQSGQLKTARNEDISWQRTAIDDELFWKCYEREDITQTPKDITPDVFYGLEHALENAHGEDKSVYRLTNDGEPCLDMIRGSYNHFETIISYDELIKNPEKYFGAEIKYDTSSPSMVEKVKKAFIQVLENRFEALKEDAMNNSSSSAYCWFDKPKVNKEDEGKLVIKFHGEYQFDSSSVDDPDWLLSEINRDPDDISFDFGSDHTCILSDESIKEFKEALKKAAWKDLTTNKEQLSFFHPEVKRELKAQQMKFKDALKAKE
jgi:hypothetical protein